MNTYWVENICGGTEYRGKSLDRAMKAACAEFSAPYVHCSTGTRPVYCDPDGDLQLGEYGEDWDEFSARIDQGDYDD